MTDSKHTPPTIPPFPWRIETDCDDYNTVQWPYRVLDKDNNEVLDFTGGCDVSDELASYIVKACNAYPGHIAAFRLLYEALVPATQGSSKQYWDAYQALVSALREAGEEL